MANNCLVRISNISFNILTDFSKNVMDLTKSLQKQTTMQWALQKHCKSQQKYSRACEHIAKKQAKIEWSFQKHCKYKPKCSRACKNIAKNNNICKGPHKTIVHTSKNTTDIAKTL